MKFDEIGNVIEKEKMTGALFNIAWKVSRPRQVVRRDGSLGNAELEQKDNPYLNVSKGVVELTTRSWLSASKLFFDMKLQEHTLRKAIGDDDYLWPFSCGIKKDSKLEPKILLRFPEGLFKELYESEFKRSKTSYMTFRNQVYMKVLRGFVSKRWFLEYLFGATPYDFAAGEVEGKSSPKRSASNNINPVVQKQADNLNYLSLKKYLETSDRTNPDGIMPNGNYADPNEMKDQGIHYLQIETVDYDPRSILGVTPLMISTLELMAGYFLMTENVDESILNDSRSFSLNVAKESPYAKSDVVTKARLFMQDILRFGEKLGFPKMQSVSDALKIRIEEPENTPAAKLIRLQGNQSLFDYGINLMQKNQNEVLDTGFDDGSARLIEESILNGISYQPVIPEANIVQIGSKMIKSGIQTSSDSALMKEIWDKKSVAKQFVEQFGFTVLSDYIVGNRRNFDEIFPRVKGMAVSVKTAEGPSDEKASLFRLAPTKEELWDAVSRIIRDGKKAMIELVVPGSVYRALFFQDRILSVIERLPAGVVGDGRRTIKQLIDSKNLSDKTNQIVIGPSEKETMDVQGVTLETIPGRGNEVLLRYDATSGTGNRSLEVLDEIDSSYLDELCRLAKALRLHDGALDIVIPNIYQRYDADHPESLIFLNAHATPKLSMHENVLLIGNQNIAKKIVMMQ